MEQSAVITREALEDIERYRKELLHQATVQIETLQYDLRRQQEWRVWCENAIPAEIYSRQLESLELKLRHEEDNRIRERDRIERIRHRENNRDLIIFSGIFGTLFWLGAEWYTSSSFNNFCFRIGSHLVSLLFGILIIGAVSAVGYWISRSYRR